VPIDQAEPADAPRPPDEPQPSRAPRPPEVAQSDPADREATYHAYRAQVDQAYAAHRETSSTWAEALPSLRADWEHHKEQYSERARAVPQTHPDNSWSSGDARRLTPDQNTEATRACAEIHDEGKRDILPEIRRIEAANPDRRLAGLDHMLKGADRLKEKIADRLRYEPELAPRQAAAEVPDAVRFTFQYSETRYTDEVLTDVQRLKEAGYELLKLKNLWSTEQYKGINSQWLRPETGLRLEVQFHTAESREAKEMTHGAYERLRDPLISEVEEDAMNDYQRRVNGFVRIPPDVSAIENYPPEKRDA
jgi:hypothetical protein